MLNNDIFDRIDRIYAALGEVQETDISNIKPKVRGDRHKIRIYQDWMGGLKEADITNLANSLIANIASLEYRLEQWAHHNNKDKGVVDKIFKASKELKIIHDLWNNDKHGYPPRQPSKSGLCPRADKFNRVLQMVTKAEEGSSMCLTFNRQGAQQIKGAGAAKVIITGDILDKDGNKVGDFYSTVSKALEAWERVLDIFGIKILISGNP